jgi:hypothetical protein
MPRYYNGYGGYPPPMGYNQGLGVRGVLIVTAIIIALVIGIFIYARVQANKDLAGQLPADYDKNTTPQDSEKIRSYVTSIQSDLEGFSATHDFSLYQALLAETDTIFKAVCIDYKRVTTRSLKADFEGDKTWFILNQPFNSGLYAKITATFKRLSIF